jgi:hypothetical protein
MEEKKEKRTAILGAFLDTLVLNVVPADGLGKKTSREFSDGLKRALDLYKAQAQHEDDDILTDFSFEQCTLLMTPKGGKGFYWIMKNKQMSIAISRDGRRCLWAQVRLSSEYLWSVRDLGRVLSEVGGFLANFFKDANIKLVPSSLDLTVDVANLDWGSVQNIKESFITRAQMDSEHVAGSLETDGFVDGPDSIHRRWRRLTGFSFGARAAAVSAVIYDKYHEIKYQKKEKGWFIDLWRQVVDENGDPVWDGESPVQRIEMRLKRPALNELMEEGEFHGIDDAFDLENLIPGLWAYLVGHVNGGDDGLPDGWLRYVTPTDDTNRSRWPVHPDWKVVQSAFAQVQLPGSNGELVQQEEESQPAPAPLVLGSTDPIRFDLRPFIRRRKRKVNTDRMVAQIAGCLVTLEAWRPTTETDVAPDLSDTMHYAYELVEDYLQKNARDFNDLTENKRLYYAEPCCTVCVKSA